MLNLLEDTHFPNTCSLVPSKEEWPDCNHAITSPFDSIFSNYLVFGAYS